MKRTLALLLAAVLCLGLTACGYQRQSTGSATESLPYLEQIPEPVPDGVQPVPPVPEDDNAGTRSGDQKPDHSGDKRHVLRIAAPKGPAGYALAKLMADSDAGSTLLRYEVTVTADAESAAVALENGDCDVAALTVTAASGLYNRTDSAVRSLAVILRSPLVLVTGPEYAAVTSIGDLNGETVYTAGEDAAALLGVLADAADADIRTDAGFNDPDELASALADGTVRAALLPEPAASAACRANGELSAALPLTEAWQDVLSGRLVQYCLAATPDYVRGHPNGISTFLADYEDSVAWIEEAPAEAAQLICEQGLAGDPALLEAALPRCQLCYLTGSAQKSPLSIYINDLYEADPSLIGGSKPISGFYYDP